MKSIEHCICFCFRYVGFNQGFLPVLLIKDPDLIKQVCIKDFDHFAERQPFTANEEDDPLWSKNLFGSRGMSYE